MGVSSNEPIQLESLDLVVPEPHVFIKQTPLSMLAAQLRDIAELAPKLARYRCQVDDTLRIFYEVKSNLRRHQIAALAAAGITEIQPGIESFSSRVLSSMRKGCSAIQQVAFLKWVRAYDIRASYALLLGTPGETTSDLDQMETLCGVLHHLPPPVALGRLSLHRFSPYFQDQSVHGIIGMRPYLLQRIAYRMPDELLSRLCYEFDFDLAEGRCKDYSLAVERLGAAVAVWRRAYFDGAALVVTRLGPARLIVRRKTARDGIALCRAHRFPALGA